MISNKYKFGEIIVKYDGTVFVVDGEGNEVPIRNSSDLALLQSNLTQTLGDSPYLVVSQKGVTDAINDMYPTMATQSYMIGNGRDKSFTINHDINTRYPFVQIINPTTNEEIFAQIIYNEGSIIINFDVVPSTNQFTVLVRWIITREEAFNEN